MSQEGFVVCPVCNTLYHDACWQDNGNRCGNLGCPGAGERVVYNVGQGATRQPRVKGVRVTQHSRVSSIVLPAGIEARLTLAAGLISGVLVWAFLAWAALSLLSASASFLPFGWRLPRNITGLSVAVMLVAGGLGLIKAARNQIFEQRRLLSTALGFLAFRLLAEAWLAAYSFGGFELRSVLTDAALIRSLSGPLGALVAGLWLATGSVIVPVGLSALLGLYLTNSVSFLWPNATDWSGEVRLALTAILLSAAVVPLLMPLPFNGLIGAAAALVPGMWLLRTHHFAPPPGIVASAVRCAVLAALFALPFAGLVHAQRASRRSLPGRGLSLSQVWEPTKRGAWAAAFVLLSVGLGALAAEWLPRDLNLGTLMPSMAREILSPYLTQISQASVGLWSLLLVYAAVFAVGRLSRRGLFYVVYRFLRWVCLTVLCGLTTIVVGQGLGIVLRSWPTLQVLGEYPDWAVLVLYGMAALLAIIFAFGYAKDRMPFPLIGLGFAIWFLQIVLLATFLSFLGGVLGLWIGKFVGPLLEAGNPQGVLGVPWGQAITVGGLLLGFVIGAGWFLVKWMGTDLGIVVSHYRRQMLKYSQLLDNRLDILLDSFRPWWAGIVMAITALWVAWQSVQTMTGTLMVAR